MNWPVMLLMMLVQSGTCTMTGGVINGQELRIVTCPILGPPPAREPPARLGDPRRDRPA